jgi:hypothetical protein
MKGNLGKQRLAEISQHKYLSVFGLEMTLFRAYKRNDYNESTSITTNTSRSTLYITGYIR